MKRIGKKSTIIHINHCVLMAMCLPHPFQRTQNVEMKEHEDFGWKIGNTMTEEEE